MIPALQYLRHGKALCGKVFKRFVETFNYHNDFIANLKGDGDLATSDGCINLDRTDPTHPVIRLNRNNLGLEQGAAAADVGCFRIKRAKGPVGDDQIFFENTYIRIGGVWIDVGTDGEWDPTLTVAAVLWQFVSLYAVNVLPSGEPDFMINTYGSFALMKQDMLNPTKLVVPLYHFDSDGKVDVDFRIAPLADCFDIAEVNYTS